MIALLALMAPKSQDLSESLSRLGVSVPTRSSSLDPSMTPIPQLRIHGSIGESSIRDPEQPRDWYRLTAGYDLVHSLETWGTIRAHWQGLKNETQLQDLLRHVGDAHDRVTSGSSRDRRPRLALVKMRTERRFDRESRTRWFAPKPSSFNETWILVFGVSVSDSKSAISFQTLQFGEIAGAVTFHSLKVNDALFESFTDVVLIEKVVDSVVFDTTSVEFFLKSQFQ